MRDRMVTAACGALAPFFPRPIGLASRVNSRAARFVIVKPASLGDVLMATPAVRALRKAFPETRLDFAVGSWSRPVIENNPALNGILDLGRIGGRGAKLVDYYACTQKLREGRFDAAFVLDRSPLISMLPWLARIPYRAGLDSDHRGFSLNIPVPCLDNRHEVELYLDVVRVLGTDVSAERLEFYPTESDRSIAKALLASRLQILRQTSIKPDTPTSSPIAIHPGGGVNPGMSLLAKRWPAERFAALADRIRRELGAEVVLLGGPGDRAVIERVRAAMQTDAIDLAGELSWGQTGALLELCGLLVSNDTGAAHLAVAVGTRAVVVFGPTAAAQYGPPRGWGEAVSLNLPCSPCFNRGRMPLCHLSQKCLSALEVDAVWPAVLRQTSNRAELVSNQVLYT